MRYLSFAQPEKSHYPIVLLVPDIRKEEILKHYLTPHGIDPDDVLVIELHREPGKKKPPAALCKEWFLEQIQPVLTDLGVTHLLVANADWFKVLAKVTKTEAHLGYVLPCALGEQQILYVPDFRSVFYDPEAVKAKIALAFTALNDHRQGSYQAPGKDIIHFAEYPICPGEIENWLEALLVEMPDLACDIETFSLKHHTSGIGTVTLCWNQHEGIAFPVDLGPDPVRVRKALRSFFERFTGRILCHKINFDVYVLIYQLFMDHLLDTEGLLNGLAVMMRHWDCTKLIAYLATNSCAGNELGLKQLAQEFAGNYAVENITDITKIPLPELLEYNLIDGLSTWYAYNKYWPTLVNDQQLDIYRTLFQPAMLDIIQMQLTGMPLNMKRVKEVKTILLAIEDQALATIHQSQVVQCFLDVLRQQHIAKRNAKLKKKQITLADDEVQALGFNPNSNPQLQALLYEMLEMPVLALTDSKEPACDGDTLKALQNHTKDPAVLEFLAALIDYKAVNKLTGSFIPAFEQAAPGPDGWHYLFGNFNLGGTVSGRLSSSEPNLQNLPANVQMTISAALITKFGNQLEGFVKKGKLNLGKLIKSCFEAPPGWLFCGLDFNSLEDRISALTTKDPEKLKVYTDGYDGHSLRAFTYWPERMPDIDITSVVSVNSVADKYPAERQDSKAPTFALTYQGTWSTLVKNCGFTEENAKLIESRFKSLYKVSIDWVSAKLDQASQDGYIVAAFGLRVRTPLLAQVIRGNSKTPREAEAEGRTAGNALGQSWCLLNTRASVEFMGKVRVSAYRLDVRPCSHIHDAQYFLIRDDIGAIQFTNKHLVSAVEWQDHPEIAHPQVHLGGELSVFHPTWAYEVTIPNGATEADIFTAMHKHLTELNPSPRQAA